jgi:hypothetical protein
MCHVLTWLLVLAPMAASLRAADWVRAGMNTNQLVWGRRGGLLFAIDPAGFRPREPRGLIRLGCPILPGGGYDLVNFIAIEPFVLGRRGFSELERSALDHVTGKRLWAGGSGADKTKPALESGELSTLASGVERLEVTLHVERFDNGAHVRIVISQRSDAPDELCLAIHTEPDSARMDYCVLTATMGNMARARQLWLRDDSGVQSVTTPFNFLDETNPSQYPV